jgi:hypothetical protein
MLGGKMSTPLIPPPPAPPKKRTVNARLEETIFEDLKRYIAYAGGGDFSHYINKGLCRVFDEDPGFRPWVAAHPGTITETRKKKAQAKQPQMVKAHLRREPSSEASGHVARTESEFITGGAHAEGVS